MLHLSRTAGLIVPVVLMLAACQSDDATGARDAALNPDRDACGATAYLDRIGQDHRQFDFSAPDRPVRIIGPDTSMTMDYRSERLNVDIDDSGTITRIWCG